MLGHVAPAYLTVAPARGKHLVGLAPRVAPSAVRVPRPELAARPIPFAMKRPQVFIHEGVRQALERRLEVAAGAPAALHVNDNVRSVITVRRRAGQLRVGVHHMFLDASASVLGALVRYVVGGDRDASLLVGRFIDAHHHRLRAERAPFRPLHTKGQCHDLSRLFQQLNARYFGGTHDALVSWGKKARSRRAQPRKSIKLGSYSAVERLIRIHPVLDRPWVPRYFVEYVLFHEMLHHTLARSQSRRLHTPEFREREARFAAYEQAVRWERAHLARLLRA